MSHVTQPIKMNQITLFGNQQTIIQ